MLHDDNYYIDSFLKSANMLNLIYDNVQHLTTLGFQYPLRDEQHTRFENTIKLMQYEGLISLTTDSSTSLHLRIFELTKEGILAKKKGWYVYKKEKEDLADLPRQLAISTLAANKTQMVYALITGFAICIATYFSYQTNQQTKDALILQKESIHIQFNQLHKELHDSSCRFSIYRKSKMNFHNDSFSSHKRKTSQQIRLAITLNV